MNRFLTALFALLLAVPALSPAADASPLATLRSEQAAVYALIRDFHMQTLLSGDPSRTAQLKTAVDKAGAGIDGLPAASGNAALDTAVRDARASWRRFAKLVLANNIGRDGYTDDNLIGELYTEAEQLSAALGKAIAAIPAGKQRAAADRAHAANLLMQRTVASYLKRGAQMSPDVGSEDPFDVGEATRTLDKQIQALGRELPSEPAMRSVNAKWNFIRASLANYNEKTVPFIIDRYATQINEGLQTVVGNLDGK